MYGIDAVGRDPWLVVGLAGQLIFSSRFLWQWIASERAGRSVVPRAFWLLSLAGSAVLLTYAIARRDPVFILGQCAGFLIYGRNLALQARPDAELDRSAARES